ncbi:glycosyltransferase family 2 protein [Aestuariibaculum marinum]|uniref:Glycosyltransferase family 2 protein n=1 Tax=Aestuariibaculum marinum TaxID=2683592 RepID=A0A8J6PV90_9FLAO|nr:glycosyltransferase family 2 protein [Aestuariibaculum marinum]MBD0823867.1 glycosyltransferase family 2 protein [Aestuariibaculum marinum]
MIEDLLIIILNYNSAKESVALYTDLLTQGAGKSKILVVDNNSTKDDQAHLLKHIATSQLRFLDVNKGYASGNRVGIEFAIQNSIPYILLLNPDIRISTESIKALLYTIKSTKDVAVIGPRICYRNNTETIYSDGGLIYLNQGCYTTHRHFKKHIKEVPASKMLLDADYVNGSVFMTRTEVFKEIGFMRDDFFLYFEETEWCMRANKKGYKLGILTEALAYHESSTKGYLYYYYMTRNRLLLSRLYSDYYKVTRKVVWDIIKKELQKSIKQRRIPSCVLRARIKGFIAGNLKKLN